MGCGASRERHGAATPLPYISYAEEGDDTPTALRPSRTDRFHMSEASRDSSSMASPSPLDHQDSSKRLFILNKSDSDNLGEKPLHAGVSGKSVFSDRSDSLLSLPSFPSDYGTARAPSPAPPPPPPRAATFPTLERRA
jgi:hypothetical protein